MKILVANLGSTSFKYRLYDMPAEQLLARGAVDRIGGPLSACVVEIGDYRSQVETEVPDHAEAVRRCLQQLTDPKQGCLTEASEVAAIGFKAVHSGRVSGVQHVDDDVLAAMAEVNHVAPAHNPPYIAAMRLLAEQLPDMPLIAAFETDFHRTIPAPNRTYAVPSAWDENFQIRRFGFHGASHRYVSQRIAEILGRDELRVISCHLGGSSSVTAVRNGRSMATSMGASPQSGLPQNNRVGDLDPFVVPVVMERTGLTQQQVLEQLANQGGLLGISGLSGDLRDLRKAADEGHPRARLAIDTFIASIRQYVGWMLVELGGADVIVFTGGIGENGADIRLATCDGLAELGIVIDHDRNTEAEGESCVSTPESRTQVWVVPTDEERIVARQVCDKLKQ